MLKDFNEELAKKALNDGISGEAVTKTLLDVVNKSDELGIVPEQIKKSMQAIIDMKDVKQTEIDNNYLSSLFKENSEKIKSALRDGITPIEISNSLLSSLNSNPENAKFLARLITTMKNKELSLKNNVENIKSYQKVMTMDKVA